MYVFPSVFIVKASRVEFQENVHILRTSNSVNEGWRTRENHSTREEEGWNRGGWLTRSGMVPDHYMIFHSKTLAWEERVFETGLSYLHLIPGPD